MNLAVANARLNKLSKDIKSLKESIYGAAALARQPRVIRVMVRTLPVLAPYDRTVLIRKAELAERSADVHGQCARIPDMPIDPLR